MLCHKSTRKQGPNNVLNKTVAMLFLCIIYYHLLLILFDQLYAVELTSIDFLKIND